MAGPAPAPSTFTISEQTGQKRTLTLTDRALPYWGTWALESVMRATATWYPGNPVGSLQVLGSQKSNTTISGEWKDRFIANPANYTDDFGAPINRPFLAPASLSKGGPTPAPGLGSLPGMPLADARAVSEAMRSICESGQLLTVTWDADTRQGICKRFKATYKRRQDITWEAEFMWISDGTPQGPAATNQPADLASVSVPALTQQLSSMQDALDTGTQEIELVEDIAAYISGALSQIQFGIQAASDAASSVVSSTLAPADALRRAASLMASIQDQAGGLFVTLDSTVYWEMEPDGDEDPAGVTVGRAVYLAEYRRQAKLQARGMAVIAAQQNQDLLEQTDQPTILAAFTARANTNLRDVSTRYYGTPSNWHQIAAFNGISGSVLLAGQTVFVPVLIQPIQGSTQLTAQTGG